MTRRIQRRTEGTDIVRQTSLNRLSPDYFFTSMAELVVLLPLDSDDHIPTDVIRVDPKLREYTPDQTNTESTIVDEINARQAAALADFTARNLIEQQRVEADTVSI